jgi:AraC-like DNA-binding protein
MRYAEHPPSAPLRPYVACYWTLASGGAPHLVLPDGCSDFIFRWGAGAGRFIGVMTRPVVKPASAPGVSFGVRFRPGAAFSLLRVAARELRDETAPLTEILGAPGRPLEGRVLAAGDLRGALRALDAALLSLLAGSRPLDPRLAAALAHIGATRGGAPLPEVARRAGLGERQLERLFDERVGMGPKALGRVIRLQAAAGALVSAPDAPLAALAHDLGYADQPHLTREFKRLSGLTPAEFAAQRRATPPGLAEYAADSLAPER